MLPRTVRIKKLFQFHKIIQVRYIHQVHQMDRAMEHLSHCTYFASGRKDGRLFLCMIILVQMHLAAHLKYKEKLTKMRTEESHRQTDPSLYCSFRMSRNAHCTRGSNNTRCMMETDTRGYKRLDIIKIESGLRRKVSNIDNVFAKLPLLIR